MSSRTREDIIQLCTILAEEEKLDVTVIEAGKGALMAAAGAFIGGLLGGPVGLGIGGTIGSITGAYSGRKKYKSVVQVIQEDMTIQQREKLADTISRIVENINIQDVTALTLFLLANGGSPKELILKELGSFLYKEMQLQISGS